MDIVKKGLVVLPHHFTIKIILCIFVFTGKYMYTEDTGRSVGDNAKLQLIVPKSMGNSTLCLTFYFHMHGPGFGTLNVFSEDTMIFTTSRYHGDNWMKVTRTVNSSNVVSMSNFVVSLLVHRSFGVKTIEICLDMYTCLNARVHCLFAFSCSCPIYTN